jgi:MFS superfamily sulfate permease-like transporter
LLINYFLKTFLEYFCEIPRSEPLCDFEHQQDFLQALKNVNWFDRSPDTPSMCQNICLSIRGGSEPTRRCLSSTVWVLSTARNAIVVVICTLMAYGFDPMLPEEATRNTTFILTGNIKAGLPAFELPTFSFNDTETGHMLDFGGMVSELGSAIVIIPLIAILENVAIAKAFCKY